MTDRGWVLTDECVDAHKPSKPVLVYVSRAFAGLVADERDLDAPKPEKVLEEELLQYTEKLACKCEEANLKQELMNMNTLNNLGSGAPALGRDG